MPTDVAMPDVRLLPDVLDALSGWQRDGGPCHLHPGDLGWAWRFGAGEVAAQLRVWRRGGETVAVGFLDGPTVLRLGLAPEAEGDVDLARRLAEDLTDPARGVLPAGQVDVEARSAVALGRLLRGEGWVDGDEWTPLTWDLSGSLPEPGLRVRVVADDPGERVDVHRASFPGSAFTAGHWRAMASGPAYRRARCLVGYARDDGGAGPGEERAVAAATVWSAGPGRPGLIEPLGVSAAHRRRGYGVAITRAAALALRELGSSSATVTTPSSNVAAVGAYVAAGFTALPPVADLRRPA